MMKNIALVLFTLVTFSMVNAQERKLNIIAIGAHPDDCDSKFGGTAALFAKMGHNVKFLALTSGEMLVTSLKGEEHWAIDVVKKLKMRVKH